MVLPREGEGAATEKVNVIPPDSGPSKGNIVIRDLQLKYRPDLDLVLRGISCNISAGQKIGICGRYRISSLLVIFLS